MPDKIKDILNKNEAFGLVESLISLAIVGTGMVLITSLSIRTIKLARKNELQDVAVQTAVEALDFLKDPGEIPADLSNIGGGEITSSGGFFYALDFEGTPRVVAKEHGYAEEILDCSTVSFSSYGVSSLAPDYTVCQQILIKSEQDSNQRFALKAIVVWETIGGEYDKRIIEGFRIGSFNVQ